MWPEKTKPPLPQRSKKKEKVGMEGPQGVRIGVNPREKGQGKGVQKTKNVTRKRDEGVNFPEDESKIRQRNKELTKKAGS